MDEEEEEDAEEVAGSAVETAHGAVDMLDWSKLLSRLLKMFFMAVKLDT